MWQPGLKPEKLIAGCGVPELTCPSVAAKDKTTVLAELTELHLHSSTSSGYVCLISLSRSRAVSNPNGSPASVMSTTTSSRRASMICLRLRSCGEGIAAMSGPVIKGAIIAGWGRSQ